MIDFVILSSDPQTQHLEFVRAAVSHDLLHAHYSPYAREYSADDIERMTAKAFRMKCPETGEVFSIAVTKLSDKIKEAPEAAQMHIKAYLNHPIRFLIERDIERLAAR